MYTTPQKSKKIVKETENKEKQNAAVKQTKSPMKGGNEE